MPPAGELICFCNWLLLSLYACEKALKCMHSSSCMATCSWGAQQDGACAYMFKSCVRRWQAGWWTEAVTGSLGWAQGHHLLLASTKKAVCGHWQSQNSSGCQNDALHRTNQLAEGVERKTLICKMIYANVRCSCAKKGEKKTDNYERAR